MELLNKIDSYLNNIYESNYVIKSSYQDGSLYVFIENIGELYLYSKKLRFTLHDLFDRLAQIYLSSYQNRHMLYVKHEDSIELIFIIDDEYINDFIFAYDIQ